MLQKGLSMCFVILTVFCKAAGSIPICHNVGTVLFFPIHKDKAQWTTKEVSLLLARKHFQRLLPPTSLVNHLNEDYITALLDHFKNSYSIVKREASDPEINSILAMALSDAFGGFLKAWVLPIAKLNFYGGTVSLDHIQKLFSLYDEIKTYLNTDGEGWHEPNDKLFSTITLNIVPRTMSYIPKDKKQSCDAIAYFEKTPNGLSIPLPTVHWNGRASTLMVPLKNVSTVRLDQLDPANTLARYYDIAVNCIVVTSPTNVGEFKEKFQQWLIRDIIPHLRDSVVYLSLEKVLTLVNRAHNFIEITPSGETKQVKCKSKTPKMSTKMIIICSIVIFEIIWCIPALIYLVKRTRNNQNTHTLLIVDQGSHSRKSPKRSATEGTASDPATGPSSNKKKSDAQMPTVPQLNACTSMMFQTKNRLEVRNITSTFIPTTSKKTMSNNAGSYAIMQFRHKSADFIKIPDTKNHSLSNYNSSLLSRDTIVPIASAMKTSPSLNLLATCRNENTLNTRSSDTKCVLPLPISTLPQKKDDRQHKNRRYAEHENNEKRVKYKSSSRAQNESNKDHKDDNRSQKRWKKENTNTNMKKFVMNYQVDPGSVKQENIALNTSERELTMSQHTLSCDYAAQRQILHYNDQSLQNTKKNQNVDILSQKQDYSCYRETKAMSHVNDPMSTSIDSTETTSEVTVNQRQEPTVETRAPFYLSQIPEHPTNNTKLSSKPVMYESSLEIKSSAMGNQSGSHDSEILSDVDSISRNRISQTKISKRANEGFEFEQSTGPIVSTKTKRPSGTKHEKVNNKSQRSIIESKIVKHVPTKKQVLWHNKSQKNIIETNIFKHATKLQKQQVLSQVLKNEPRIKNVRLNIPVLEIKPPSSDNNSIIATDSEMLTLIDSQTRLCKYIKNLNLEPKPRNPKIFEPILEIKAAKPVAETIETTDSEVVRSSASECKGDYDTPVTSVYPSTTRVESSDESAITKIEERAKKSVNKKPTLIPQARKKKNMLRYKSHTEASDIQSKPTPALLAIQEQPDRFSKNNDELIKEEQPRVSKIPKLRGNTVKPATPKLAVFVHKTHIPTAVNEHTSLLPRAKKGPPNNILEDNSGFRERLNDTL